MKLRTNTSIYFFIAVLSLASCHKIGPAAFWTNFHKELILSRGNDQGPWGGKRNIYWKSETPYTFSGKELIAFAAKNGWELVDSVFIPSATVVQPFHTNIRIDDYTLERLKQEVLPKWGMSNMKVFIFKTDMVSVQPEGTSTEQNGFVALSTDGKTIQLYHLWGE